MSTKLTLLGRLIPLTLNSASFVANLLWTTCVWGQSSAMQDSPLSEQTDQGSVLKLYQLEKPSTKAADLLHTCVQEHDPSEVSDNKVKSSCQDQTKKIAQTDSSGEKEDGESGILQPTKDRLQINFGDRDPDAFNWGLGSLIGEPTALQGGTRLKASPTVGQIDAIFPVGGHLVKGFGPNQRVLLEFFGDVQAVVLDLSYTIVPQSIPGEFSVNAQTTRSFIGAFVEGDNVDLPGGADSWVHRSGGGVEYVVDQ